MAPPTAISISQLATLINGKPHGEEVTITGVNSVHEASDGDIAFVDNPELLPVGERSEAAALIVPPRVHTEAKPIIVTEDPRLAFSQVLAIFAPERRVYHGIHPTAVIGAKVVVEEGVSIGAHAVIGDNVRLGRGTVIHPLVYIGHDATIGAETEIHPQVYVGERVSIGDRCLLHAGAVIGSDGFGFLQQSSGHRKIPQIGTVFIGDDVEIGANSTIDRATISATIVGSGTKLDDNVHIAHNCVIGNNCMFAGQVGIAGSTRVGNNVIMGGQVGANDHISICDNVIIGARSGIISDIEEPGVYSGFPARGHRTQMRVMAGAQKLPELFGKIRELEERLAALENPAGD